MYRAKPSDHAVENADLVSSNIVGHSYEPIVCDMQPLNLNVSERMNGIHGAKEEETRCRQNQLTEWSDLSSSNDSHNRPPSTYIYFFLIVAFAAAINIVLCIWTLMTDEITGIYVILLYVHGFFQFGQGILSFLFFFDFTNINDVLRHLISRRRIFGFRSDYVEI